MDFRTQATGPGGRAQVAADALLVIVCGEGAIAALEPPIAAALKSALDDGDFAMKPGKALLMRRVDGVKATRLAFAAAPDGSARAVGKAAAAALAMLRSGGTRRLAVTLAGAAPSADHAEAVFLAAGDAGYAYRATKPGANDVPKLESVTLLAERAALPALKDAPGRAAAIAAGVELAKECANRPANHCTPTYLAEVARQLAKAHGFKLEVLERKDCEKLGMGAFLAVAQGSEQPPKFIVLRYQGAAAKAAPVVLVGKGITFDTGGISIKPAAEMDEMKFDMGGAASVLGTFRALAGLQPRLNVVGLIPCCENMPSGRAVKPGDVVTSLAGKTIEILNTDAEGRLILCDALTYAERFKPQAVVDIATLTGACLIALGRHRTGLFTSDDALAAELLAAGERTQDLAWRMPVDEEYDEGLKSNFADMANVGPRQGGAIIAAMFLKRFAQAFPWAHLDIAGTSWKSGPAKGATGRPVPLLTEFLLARAG